MFGAKAEAPATVVDVEQHGRGMSQGELKYRFVLEVQPPDSQPFRVMVEHVFLYSDVVPEQGGTVNVEYEVKHPDKAKLALDGDPRYDRKLMKERQKEQGSAREDQLQAELAAPPGTPSPSAQQAEPDTGDGPPETEDY
jgi:hypothetical protein